jgi:MinD-like ATPase involved in chromosome partitioning or flagellar assembly
MGGDEGSPIVVRAPESTAAQSIRAIAQKVAAAVSVQNLLRAPRQFQADPTLSILN